MNKIFNISHVLLLTAILLLTAACSSDSSNDVQPSPTPNNPQEISIQTDVRKMAEGTRAATYENVTDLQSEAHFTCTAFEAGTLTPYIPTTTVDWDSGETRWEFNGGASHYYWPLPATNGGAYPSLDFFGYMPSMANLSTEAPYIGSVSYTAAHNVTFTCSSLPMTKAEQDAIKEFMFGMALDQSYNNAAIGVPLQFQHPFARIKLILSSEQADVTIHSITFKDIKNNGSFTYNHSASTSTWTPSDEYTDLVLTLNADFTANAAIGTYIIIPQEWAGVIVVDADCLFWGDKVNYPSLTTTVPTTWQPGNSYTYTFNISPDDLKVNISKFTEQW